MPCTRLRAALGDLFRDEGINVRLRTNVRAVEGKSGTEVRVLTEGPDGESAVEGTDLLVAVGRTPNTVGIGLEQAGVELTERGYIKVDERLATTASGVWAMGECAGSPQFTHVAFDDFRVVYGNLTGGRPPQSGRVRTPAVQIYSNQQISLGADWPRDGSGRAARFHPQVSA